MDRREFLKSIGPAATALGAGILPARADPEPIREFSRGGMRYRRLGRTGVFTSAFGFGAHTDYQQRVKGPDGVHLREDFQQLRTRQTDRAIDLGLNVVDVYDEAQQWEPLAQLAKGKRDRILIATKFNEGRAHVGEYIDRAARLFGHTDLGRYVVRFDDAIPPASFENWDLLRKAKAAGKIRVIGIATHSPEVMLQACNELEGLEFIQFPYNFIHSRAAYSDLIPLAVAKGIGLVAMKPLASGSIVKLDPHRPRPNARPEETKISTALKRQGPLMEQAVAKLVAELDRSPGETLAQSALRFVFAQPFLACSLVGMFLPEELEENHQAWQAYTRRAEQPRAGLLEAAGEVAALSGRAWLPSHYEWLDEKWTSRQS